MGFLNKIFGKNDSQQTDHSNATQKLLISAKEELLRKEKEEARIETRKISEKPALDFYATLTEKKKQARLKHIPSAHVEKEKYPKSIAEKETPPARKARRLTVQVASLKNAKEAGNLIRRLRKKGYDAYKYSVQIPKRGTWNRVCVGDFNTNREAQVVLARLRKEEKLDPILVKSARGKGKE